MSTALVFAAQSFIGQYIVRDLLARGHQVIGTCRRPAKESADRVCDLLHRELVDAVVRDVRPQLIVQCGAATASRDPRELYATHLQGTLNVLDAIVQHVPDARTIFMGSAAEYGALPEDWLPLTEERLPRPSSFFGASKLAQTQLVQAAAAERKLQLAVVRPFNVIGAGLPDIYFAASLSRRLLTMRHSGQPAGATFEVTNPTATRDFVDVTDVAAAIGLLFEQATGVWSAGQCEIFNIATQRETTLMQLAEVLGQAVGGFIPVPGGSHQSRGAINRSAGSYAKLHAATGWQPQVEWSAGARSVFEHCSQARG